VSSVQHLTAYRADGAVAWRLEADLFVDEILPLRDGDVAIAGWFIAPLVIGGKRYPASDKNQKFLLARLSRRGAARWVHVSRGGTEGDLGMPSPWLGEPDPPNGFLAETPDGGLVVLASVWGGGGHVLLRYGRGGRETWRQHIPPDNGAVSPSGIAVDARGDIYLAGTVDRPTRLGELELDPGHYPVGDVMVAKLEGTNPRWLWARAFGSAGDDKATALAVLPDGDVLVAGQLARPAALGCVAQRGVASRAFVVALSATDGACRWWRSYPAPADVGYARAYFDAIAVEPRGLVVTGYLPATKDDAGGRVLAGLSPTGELAWTVPVGLHVHTVALGDRGIRVAGLPTGDRAILGERLDGDRGAVAVVELR
jgi:hypothetical protein